MDDYLIAACSASGAFAMYDLAKSAVALPFQKKGDKKAEEELKKFIRETIEAKLGKLVKQGGRHI